MGDDETRDGELRERGVDRPLVLQVEVRSALVQDQDPGAAVERAGDQHPLLLAPGQSGTHVPDQALVAHRHAFYVFIDLSVFGALAHPAHVNLLIEPRDVLGDGALQQAVVLGDEGDKGDDYIASALDASMAQLPSIQQTCSFSEVAESCPPSTTTIRA